MNDMDNIDEAELDRLTQIMAHPIGISKNSNSPTDIWCSLMSDKGKLKRIVRHYEHEIEHIEWILENPELNNGNYHVKHLDGSVESFTDVKRQIYTHYDVLKLQDKVKDLESQIDKIDRQIGQLNLQIAGQVVSL